MSKYILYGIIFFFAVASAGSVIATGGVIGNDLNLVVSLSPNISNTYMTGSGGTWTDMGDYLLPNSTYAVSVNITGIFTLPELASCDTIDTYANGTLHCGSDADSGGSGSDTNASTECSGNRTFLSGEECVDISLLYYNETTDFMGTQSDGLWCRWDDGNTEIDCDVSPVSDTTIPDTNASTECLGDQALLGNGSCQNTSIFLTSESDPTFPGDVWVNESGDVMSGTLTVDAGGLGKDITGGTDTNDMLKLYANTEDSKPFIAIYGNGDGIMINPADGENIQFTNEDTMFATWNTGGSSIHTYFDVGSVSGSKNLTVFGYGNFTENVIATYFIGDGSQLTGITAEGGGNTTEEIWSVVDNGTFYYDTNPYGFYNLSDFDITDYSTTATILGWGYYNSTDFSISDYYPNTNPFSFWNDSWAGFNKTYADTLYLTSETDPNWFDNFTNSYNNDDWDTAHGWGDHGEAGYQTGDEIGNCSADQDCANVLYTTDEYLGGLSCSDTQIAKWNDTASAWECESDDNTGANEEDPNWFNNFTNSYNKTQWDMAVLYVTNGTFQIEIGSDCGAGNYSYGVNDDGSLKCREDTQGTGTMGKQGDGTYLYNDTDTMYLNETKLNETIDLLDDDTDTWNTTEEIWAVCNNGTLLISESDPLWSGNESLVAYIADEGDWNVNSSGHWDNFDSANTTQFEDDGGVLHIIASWLSAFIDAWLGGKTTNDLIQGSTNLYDNQSWNQSLADSLYYDDTTVSNCSVDQSCANVLYTTDAYLGGLSCSDTQIAKWNDTASAWECEADESGAGGTDTNASTECDGDTTYLSGDGNCNDISALYLSEETDPNWYNNFTNSYNNDDWDSIVSQVNGNTSAWVSTWNETYDGITRQVNENVTLWATTFNSTYHSIFNQVNGNVTNWVNTYNASYHSIMNQVNGNTTVWADDTPDDDSEVPDDITISSSGKNVTLGSGDVIVAETYRYCLVADCSKYIAYNGTHTVIQG